MLLGLESAGKSALFRGLTGARAGDEANFRGSTVTCRRGHAGPLDCDIVDTPGLRAAGDSEAIRLTLLELGAHDLVVLVVRATHLREELLALLERIDLRGHRAAVILTFADKARRDVPRFAAACRRGLGVPVAAIDARRLSAAAREEVTAAIKAAVPLTLTPRVPDCPRRDPEPLVFERPISGPILAIMVTMMLFALPVYAAYQLSAWLQPLADTALLLPLKSALGDLPPLPRALLSGDYGVLTLGWNSFLWAFPVVVLIGLSVAITEEIGLKDRLTHALDPLMRRIGLSGRDLIPVLSGFGCNVVAVFQSRACSTCTRRGCVSLIAFGSACSYQIGATLSVFAAAGHPGLFAPYLGALFLAGAMHTRFWHGAPPPASRPLSERAFLQRPSRGAVLWRLRGGLRQFLLQAMPIFLAICAAAALLEFSGLLRPLTSLLAPAFSSLDLPREAAPAVVFSLIRKDGVMLLNEGGGALLHALTPGQIFLLVWMASTLSACLVTLWTIRRELGWRYAASLAIRQAVTAIVTSALLAALI